MMTRLVPVNVLSDHPADVLDVGVLMWIDLGIEHCVELCYELPLSTEQIDEPLHIVWLIPGVLPGIALGEAAADSSLRRIEWDAILAVGQTWLHETVFGVKAVAPVCRSFRELAGRLCVLRRCSHAGNCPIIKSILDGFRCSLAIMIYRNITQPHVFRSEEHTS